MLNAVVNPVLDSNSDVEKQDRLNVEDPWTLS